LLIGAPTRNIVDVCLVTTGHPSTNPRLVKELSSLLENGYSVHVVASKFIDWADLSDQHFMTWNCTWSWVPFGPFATKPKRVMQVVTQRLAKLLLNYVGDDSIFFWLNGLALHPVSWDLQRVALSIPARLYIAHNLAALPAAYISAKKHHGKLGFDAEDYHRGEFTNSGIVTKEQLIVEKIESKYMPQCDYITAASDGISEAYYRDITIKMPVTILNVFPKTDLDFPLSSDEKNKEKLTGTFSLYWFSQTIGPERGLEDIVKALRYLPENVQLRMRGNCNEDYKASIYGLAKQYNVSERRLVFLGLRPPEEMIVRAQCHDIGLALGQPNSINRDICVTNKIFTYLLSGIPCIATKTQGQESIARSNPDGIQLVDIGDYLSIVECVRAILFPIDGKAKAIHKSNEVYCWENESRIFIDIIGSVLS